MPVIKFRLATLVSFILVLFAITSISFAKTLQGKVIKVADGDTVTIVDDKDFKYRIRLAGIDAPEKDQPYGNESTKSLKWLVYGRRITVEYSKFDRYGRIVGKVFISPRGDMFCLAVDCIGKVDVGLKQINAGLAWHYKSYESEQLTADRRLYSSAERVARKKKLGLWNDKKLTPPWQWRRANKLQALLKRFNEVGGKEKTYAMSLRMEPDQLKKFLDEAIWNEFQTSGLKAEEFAAEFKIPPQKLKNIIKRYQNPQKATKYNLLQGMKRK